MAIPHILFQMSIGGYVAALRFGTHLSDEAPRMDGATGVPVHSAPIRTMYFDETTGVMYVNNDGATGWTAMN